MSLTAWFLVGWCIGTVLGLVGIYFVAKWATGRWGT